MNGRASLQRPIDKGLDNDHRHLQDPRPKKRKPLKPPTYGPPPTTRPHHLHDDSPLSQHREIAALPRGNNGRDQSTVRALPPKSHDDPRGRRGLTLQHQHSSTLHADGPMPQDVLGAFAPSLCLHRATWRGDQSLESSRGLSITPVFANSEQFLYRANNKWARPNTASGCANDYSLSNPWLVNFSVRLFSVTVRTI